MPVNIFQCSVVESYLNFAMIEPLLLYCYVIDCHDVVTAIWGVYSGVYSKDLSTYPGNDAELSLLLPSFLPHRGQLKLGDFGLARLYQSDDKR